MAIPKLAMIPSGYKANKVYSVLPTDGSGDLDFARTTKATRVNSDGLIEEVLTGVPRLDYTDGGCPSLLLEGNSTNLITQSESFGNSYWTKNGASIQGDASTAGAEILTGVDLNFGTDVANFSAFNSAYTKWVAASAPTTFTVSSGVLTMSDASNGRGVQLPSIIPVGSSAILEVNVSAITGTWAVYTYTTSYIKLHEFTTTGAKEFNITDAGAIGSLYIRSVTSGASISINASGINNSVKEVQGFSAPSVDSPLGAFKLVEDTSNGQHAVIRNISNTLNESYTYSVRVKSSGRNYLRIREATLTGAGADFDLLNKTATIIQGNTSNLITTTATITELYGGFFNISFTYKPNATGNYNFTTSISESLGNTSYTGDGTSGVYIFASQLEQNSSATSYIKTSGTAISRTADSASKSGISSLIGQTEGTIFLDTVISTDIDGLSRISLSQGTSTSDWIFFSAPEVAGGLIRSRIFINNGNIGQVDIYGGYLASGRHKFALAYKENDVVLYVDGVLDLSDNSALIPSTDTVSLNGSSPSSVNAVRTSKHSDFRLYNTRLSNSELQILTTI